MATNILTHRLNKTSKSSRELFWKKDPKFESSLGITSWSSSRATKGWRWPFLRRSYKICFTGFTCTMKEMKLRSWSSNEQKKLFWFLLSQIPFIKYLPFAQYNEISQIYSFFYSFQQREGTNLGEVVKVGLHWRSNLWALAPYNILIPKLETFISSEAINHG